MAPVNRERYYVTVTRPDGVSITEMSAYIRERLSVPMETPLQDHDLHVTVRRESIEAREFIRLQSIAPDSARSWGAAALQPQPLDGVPTDILKRCQANNDGECYHAACPQLRDDEPKKSRRHCPLDQSRDDPD
jgi:hypothetical protein